MIVGVMNEVGYKNFVFRFREGYGVRRWVGGVVRFGIGYRLLVCEGFGFWGG